MASSSSTDALPPLAKKVPAVKRSGDQQEDNRRLLVRKALVQIIAALSEADELVLPTLGALQGGLIHSQMAKTLDASG